MVYNPSQETALNGGQEDGDEKRAYERWSGIHS